MCIFSMAVHRQTWVLWSETVSQVTSICFEQSPWITIEGANLKGSLTSPGILIRHHSDSESNWDNIHGYSQCCITTWMRIFQTENGGRHSRKYELFSIGLSELLGETSFCKIYLFIIKFVLKETAQFVLILEKRC